ncbi:MAG: undecaprenyl-diphosphate phosphatase [Bacteroidales bacterium]|nr:undecaprenyl-diphosphate phosphatase [Bacteroidales bacterium]
MNGWEAFLLGLVQGLTEYLPVSSSGHLEIGNYLLGTSGKENLTFTVAVHFATVMSTVVVLWPEIWSLVKGFFKFKFNEETQYVLKIFVSMIPVMLVGFFLKDQVEALFGNGLIVVGIMLLVTASLLAFSYFAKPRIKEKITWRDAFIVGIAQACAVLPGLSRSGSTIATGLLLGNKKESIAQFSFIMVIIPILGESFLQLISGELIDATDSGLPLSSLLIGVVTAFVSGYIACKWMLKLVKNGKLIWFALYCTIVGLLALILPLV